VWLKAWKYRVIVEMKTAGLADREELKLESEWKEISDFLKLSNDWRKTEAEFTRESEGAREQGCNA
jgi:hypothetical protein